MLPAPGNGARGAAGQRWLEQGWTEQSRDAASLADPKVVSQLFRGIREGCNVRDHVCREEQPGISPTY